MPLSGTVALALGLAPLLLIAEPIRIGIIARQRDQRRDERLAAWIAAREGDAALAASDEESARAAERGGKRRARIAERGTSAGTPDPSTAGDRSRKRRDEKPVATPMPE